MTGAVFAQGGCTCGAIRYALLRAPMFTHCCHCRDCQRQAGSAFVINALIETENVRLDQGMPVAIAMPTPSGRPHDIYRCAACATALWSDYGHRAGLRFVRVGALDAPEQVVPDVHIFTRSKLPWVGLPPDALAVDVYYDTAAVWPAEALQRREAATKPPGG